MNIEIADITHKRNLRIMENLIRVEICESLKFARPVKSRIIRSRNGDIKQIDIIVDCKTAHYTAKIFIFYVSGKVQSIVDIPTAVGMTQTLMQALSEYTQEVTRLNGVPW